MDPHVNKEFLKYYFLIHKWNIFSEITVKIIAPTCLVILNTEIGWS